MSDLESFNSIIATEFLPDMETDAETIVYGIRVLFYRTDVLPSQTMTRLMPYLTYDLSQAYLTRSMLTRNMSHNKLRAFIKYDSKIWSPLAARVVQLAQLPF